MMLAGGDQPAFKPFDRRRVHRMRHSQVIGMHDHQFRVPLVTELFRQRFARCLRVRRDGRGCQQRKELSPGIYA